MLEREVLDIISVEETKKALHMAHLPLDNLTDDNGNIKSLSNLLDELSDKWNQVHSPEKAGEALKKICNRLATEQEKDLAIAISSFEKYKKRNPKSGEEYRCVGCTYFHDDICENANSPNYKVPDITRLDCGECFQRKETRCGRCKHMYEDFNTGNRMCRSKDHLKEERANGYWIWAYSRYCGNCFEPIKRGDRE